MNAKEVLTKVKVLLGMEVNLASMKLADGVTTIEAENWDAGTPVVIVQEGGNVPLPMGEYELEDGRILVVSEDGIIGEVKDAMPAEQETEIEINTGAPQSEEMSTEATPQAKKTVESIVKETFFSEIEQLKTEKEALKAELVELKSQIEPKKEEVELSEQEPVKPIVYNPENTNVTKTVYPKWNGSTESTIKNFLNQ